MGELETAALFEDPFVVAVPKGHRLASRRRIGVEDLEDEDVLLLDEEHCLRLQALAICERASACELGDFRASSLSTLIQMIAGGVGITLLPQMAVDVEVVPKRRMKLLPFSRTGPSRTIGLAWRASSMRKHEFFMLGETINLEWRKSARRG